MPRVIKHEAFTVPSLEAAMRHPEVDKILIEVTEWSAKYIDSKKKAVVEKAVARRNCRNRRKQPARKVGQVNFKEMSLPNGQKGRKRLADPSLQKRPNVKETERQQVIKETSKANCVMSPMSMDGDMDEQSIPGSAVEPVRALSRSGIVSRYNASTADVGSEHLDSKLFFNTSPYVPSLNGSGLSGNFSDVEAPQSAMGTCSIHSPNFDSDTLIGAQQDSLDLFIDDFGREFAFYDDGSAYEVQVEQVEVSPVELIELLKASTCFTDICVERQTQKAVNDLSTNHSEKLASSATEEETITASEVIVRSKDVVECTDIAYEQPLAANETLTANSTLDNVGENESAINSLLKLPSPSPSELDVFPSMRDDSWQKVFGIESNKSDDGAGEEEPKLLMEITETSTDGHHSVDKLVSIDHASFQVSEDSFSPSASINENIDAIDEFKQRTDTTPPSVEACCLKAVVAKGSAENENYTPKNSVPQPIVVRATPVDATNLVEKHFTPKKAVAQATVEPIGGGVAAKSAKKLSPQSLLKRIKARQEEAAKRRKELLADKALSRQARLKVKCIPTTAVTPPSRGKALPYSVRKEAFRTPIFPCPTSVKQQLAVPHSADRNSKQKRFGQCSGLLVTPGRVKGNLKDPSAFLAPQLLDNAATPTACARGAVQPANEAMPSSVEVIETSKNNLVAEQSVVQKLNGTSTCLQRSTTCSNYEITIRDTSSDDDDDDENLAKAHKHVPSWAQEKQLEMAFVAQMRTADPGRIFAECRVPMTYEDIFGTRPNVSLSESSAAWETSNDSASSAP
uniref:INCENP_ARK-bind domain-containing protein n=1 Tax=Trichuris muris TaxID=70415 RepID=A0A5S6QLL0_TRIMR